MRIGKARSVHIQRGRPITNRSCEQREFDQPRLPYISPSMKEERTVKYIQMIIGKMLTSQIQQGGQQQPASDTIEMVRGEYANLTCKERKICSGSMDLKVTGLRLIA